MTEFLLLLLTARLQMLSPTAEFVKAFGRTASLLAAQLRANKARYSSANKSLPHRQEIRIIDGKDLNSGSANCRFARKCGSCPHEVSIPVILPWMKESNKVRLCSDQCRLCSNLAPFATQVREADSQERLALQSACNDVIDVNARDSRSR